MTDRRRCEKGIAAMNRDLKSFLKGGAMIAGLGIGAAHFLSDDPHVMPEKILTVMVSASVIGAADGMASLGWENRELEARVEKVGDLQNVSYSDIMPEIRPDNCGGFANMTFGRGASGEYARLALSQTISYQHEFFSFMREVRWKDYDTPEEYEAARAARRAEIDDLVIDGWVTRSGFYNPPDESLRAVSEKTAGIETPSPI